MRNIANVFYITIALIILAVGYGALAPDSFEAVTTTIKDFVASTFGWYYMVLMSFMLALCVFIILSPYGKIHLAKILIDLSTQESLGSLCYFLLVWVSGLVFWGAAEPLSHYAISLRQRIQRQQQLERRITTIVLPLGITCLGHVCHRCLIARIFPVP